MFIVILITCKKEPMNTVYEKNADEVSLYVRNGITHYLMTAVVAYGDGFDYLDCRVASLLAMTGGGVWQQYPFSDLASCNLPRI